MLKTYSELLSFISWLRFKKHVMIEWWTPATINPMTIAYKKETRKALERGKLISLHFKF